MWQYNYTNLSNELYHYGIKGMRWGIRKSGKVNSKRHKRKSLKLKDERINKSVGAKSKNYIIKDLETGEIFHLSEGTKIQNSTVFAGKGTSKPLKEKTVNILVKRHGGDPSKWQHAKGKGVIDYYGEDRSAEIHWFQEQSVGKHDFKIKKWLDY